MAVPAGLYGSEIWTMTKGEKSRLQASEMRFLRSTLGITRRYKIRNDDIRKELNIFNLCDKVDEYKKSWLNHVQRMETGRLPKMFLIYKSYGRRNLGRPRKKWLDY